MNEPAGAWLENTWSTLGERLLALLPTLAVVLGIVVLGWIVAFLADRATRWLVRRTRLETLGERAGVAKILYAVGARSGLARFSGRVVFWAVLLLTFSAAAEAAGLTALAQLGSRATAYLPRLIAAFAVLVAGSWLGQLARRLVTARGARLTAPRLVGEVAFYAVLAVTITMAAEQAGVDTDLVGNLLTVVVGGVAAALALSFALASRPTFASLLARRYCERSFPVGRELEHARFSGRVVGYSSTSVLLEVDEHTMQSVPCAMLVAEPLVYRDAADQDPSTASSD